MISRQLLRRLSGQYRRNQDVWYLRPFGPLLSHPMYIALNRKSVVGATGVGVFVSMLPLPGHTVIAVLLALVLQVNLGVAALATWFNSPLTMLPVYYLEYRLGALLLRAPLQEWPASVSWEWLWSEIFVVWRPLFLGAFISATLTGLVMFLGLNALWRWSAHRRYRRRPASSGVRKPAPPR
jgi:uncharacterized protein (DUF2062 family)